MDKINKISVILLASLMTFLMITHGIKYISNGQIKYEYATKITTYDDIETFGVFIRDEIVVENDADGLIYLVMPSGEKISKGDNIALNYQDEKYLELNRKLESLLNEQELLESVAVVNQNTSENTKTSILINNQIANFNLNLDNSSVSDTENIIDDIKGMSIKSAYSQMSKEDLDLIEIEMNNEISTLRNSIGNHISTVEAMHPGYFVYGTDGLENISKDEVDVAYIENLKNQNITLNQNNFGKIITSFKWELAVIVNSDQVSQMEDALKLRIYLENISDKEIPVEIVGVVSEGEKSVVFLEGDFTSKDILEARATNVKIILREYEGIKIPKAATRVRDGNLGIYSLRGYQAVFIEIEPIFEKDDYYLIDFDGIDIISGDRIIIESKELNKNQIIK